MTPNVLPTPDLSALPTFALLAVATEARAMLTEHLAGDEPEYPQTAILYHAAMLSLVATYGDAATAHRALAAFRELADHWYEHGQLVTAKPAA